MFVTKPCYLLLIATVHLISCPRLCSRLLVMLSKLLSCSDSVCSSLPCCKPSCSLCTVFASCSALSLPAKCFFSLLISCCCRSSSAYPSGNNHFTKIVSSQQRTVLLNHLETFLTYKLYRIAFLRILFHTLFLRLYDCLSVILIKSHNANICMMVSFANADTVVTYK